MSGKKRILVQLDGDRYPSVFDAVVATDAGVEQLLQYGGVEVPSVEGLVHGCIFTRGPADLHQTAIFIGGSSVATGEAIAREVQKAFFGPMRVSFMVDGNGSNTTAAAAVVCAGRHLDLSQVTALVLAGTGPVGLRVAKLLARSGSRVRLASRDLAKGEAACQVLRSSLTPEASLSAVVVRNPSDVDKALTDCSLVVACGAAGVQLLPADILAKHESLKVAIDLNAVPPSGIEGIGVTDAAKVRGARIDYGAIGVGGLKMKIHKEAIRSLFTRNDLKLDTEEIFEIGRKLA